MGRPEFWNHSAAYYPWLRRQLAGRRRILDVGCGEGALARYLAEPGRVITGIDPDEGCILRSVARTAAGTEFLCCTMEAFSDPGPFDAVVFSASLHHMDGEKALEKAAALLGSGGLLLIVGLARPSSVGDWLLEGLRVLPSAVLSRLHRQQRAEELGVPGVLRAAARGGGAPPHPAQAARRQAAARLVLPLAAPLGKVRSMNKTESAEPGSFFQLCAFLRSYALGFAGFRVTGFRPPQLPRRFRSSSRFFFLESFS